MKRSAPEFLPLSALNALEYCPRRFYYEFVQGDMLENEFVLAGTLIHEHIDEPGLHHTQAGDIRINRLYLQSEHLHLSGFADLVEEEDGRMIPVEYKHGKEGKWLNDHMQLCAQALCLEERLPGHPSLPYGSIFYFGSRKRVQVPFTPELRARTRARIDVAMDLATSDAVPPPLEGKIAARCRDCSLRALCLPEEVLHLNKSGRKKYAHAVPD
jgi:CRISPR-associated exonuclease Cas4